MKLEDFFIPSKVDQYNGEASLDGTSLEGRFERELKMEGQNGVTSYQSATGVITLSGWFPTTWSIKFSFPGGLRNTNAKSSFECKKRESGHENAATIMKKEQLDRIG